MSPMEIAVVGLNHKTAPVALRERFSVSPSNLPEALSAFTRTTGLSSCVILSTCNRTELYTLLPEVNGALGKVRNFLSEYHKVDEADFRSALYTKKGEEGISHLFRVAAGLDSQVLGESEITGQVKQAYQAAHAVRCVEKPLHLLFQRSLRVAKRVRTETGIGRGLCSIGSVAVEMAEKIFGELSRRSILVIGAGKMGEVTARHLFKGGARTVFVSNRSFERAKVLAERLKGKAVQFDALPEMLGEVDIAISSTAAPHSVVTKETVTEVMKKRHGRPLFLIDISVPRDIEPEVNDLENVFLYDIDDLEGITRSGFEERKREMERGLSLIEEELVKFLPLLKPFLSRG